MLKIEMIDIVKQILEKEIKKHFSNEELAFLGLTSKIENPIRDLVALRLKKILGSNFIIAREWKRCDLAVLRKDNTPVCLIEFKACYSFDLFNSKNRKNYTELVKGDLQKSDNLKNKYSKHSHCFSILLVSKPKDLIPNKYNGIIKYRSGINSNLKKCNENISKLETTGHREIIKNFENIVFGKIAQDSAFGIKYGLDYYLITKIS
jgi:hypothetical protein